MKKTITALCLAVFQISAALAIPGAASLNTAAAEAQVEASAELQTAEGAEAGAVTQADADQALTVIEDSPAAADTETAAADQGQTDGISDKKSDTSEKASDASNVDILEPDIAEEPGEKLDPAVEGEHFVVEKLIEDDADTVDTEKTPDKEKAEQQGEELKDEEEAETGNETGAQTDNGNMALFSKAVTASISGNEYYIYNYLTGTAGFNTAAACGILANLFCEAKFNPSNVGDHGTSYGICQWHNGRMMNLLSFMRSNGLATNDLNGQLDFMMRELRGSYSGVLAHLYAVPDTSEGAYDAASYFCLNYEVPYNRNSAAKTRGNLAKRTYWAAYAEGREEATILVRAASDEDSQTVSKNSATKTDDVKTGAASENKDKNSTKSTAGEETSILERMTKAAGLKEVATLGARALIRDSSFRERLLMNGDDEDADEKDPDERDAPDKEEEIDLDVFKEDHSPDLKYELIDEPEAEEEDEEELRIVPRGFSRLLGTAGDTDDIIEIVEDDSDSETEDASEAETDEDKASGTRESSVVGEFSDDDGNVWLVVRDFRTDRNK